MPRLGDPEACGKMQAGKTDPLKKIRVFGEVQKVFEVQCCDIWRMKRHVL